MTVTLEDIGRHKVAIWGAGKEGLAAAGLIRKRWPRLPLILADDNPNLRLDGFALREDDVLALGVDKREEACRSASVVVKAPGIGLYHPYVLELSARGARVTSLLNLWASLPRQGKTIGVTGTKGKSTTSSLLAHILRRLGHSVSLLGNIGTPPGCDLEHEAAADYCVIEISSYQAAQFDGVLDLAVLTNLEPEHLDWHGSVERYYADKLNLFAHARCGVAPVSVQPLLERWLPDSISRSAWRGASLDSFCWVDTATALSGSDGADSGGSAIKNEFLARPHNVGNLALALRALRHFSCDARKCLDFSDDYRGLPHRQQMLGERGGILFVDDSISTTPQAAMAALSVWRDRPISLILGGFDRGIDYQPLVSRLLACPLRSIAAMGPSGARIAQTLKDQGYSAPLSSAATMEEAVSYALGCQAPGGIVLLSPAAPSYGLFKDFTERGEAFAKCCGLARNCATADQTRR